MAKSGRGAIMGDALTILLWLDEHRGQEFSVDEIEAATSIPRHGVFRWLRVAEGLGRVEHVRRGAWKALEVPTRTLGTPRVAGRIQG